MNIWVDIDKPTKTFGIHNENKSRNPNFKGINETSAMEGGFNIIIMGK